MWNNFARAAGPSSAFGRRICHSPELARLSSASNTTTCRSRVTRPRRPSCQVSFCGDGTPRTRPTGAPQDEPPAGFRSRARPIAQSARYGACQVTNVKLRAGVQCCQVTSAHGGWQVTNGRPAASGGWRRTALPPGWGQGTAGRIHPNLPCIHPNLPPPPKEQVQQVG